VLTTAVGVLGRAIAIAVGLVLVPVVFSYLGDVGYGIWVTISAGIAWLGLIQFGIAPSLVNQLAPLGRAGDGRQRGQLVSTAWALALAIGVVALLPMLFVVKVLPLEAVFNVAEDHVLDGARGALSIVIVGFAASIPLAVAAAVLRADQAGYVATAWTILGSLLTVVGVTLAVAADAGLPGIAAAFTAGSLVAAAAMSIDVFVRRSPELRPRLSGVDWYTARHLLGAGAGFSTLMIASLVIAYTDPIVITQLLGPASVPRYAIAFSLLAAFISFEMVVLDAAWPAFSESAARGDNHWLRRTHRRVTVFLVTAAIAFGLCLALVGQPFIGVWAGEGAVPPQSLLLVLAALAVVQAVQLPHGRLLTALGRVRLNAGLGLVNAGINLPLSIALASTLGITGVAIGTLAGYTVVGAWLVIKAQRLLAHLPDDQIGMPVVRAQREVDA
jgi:O-antigen/teichoic acid export membrane protein